jgi:hypothetical protein
MKSAEQCEGEEEKTKTRQEKKRKIVVLDLHMEKFYELTHRYKPQNQLVELMLFCLPQRLRRCVIDGILIKILMIL